MEPIGVYQLNEYIRQLLTADSALNGIRVEGEISGFNKYPSGHMYFTLKDERAAVDCAFFRGANYGLTFRPANGDRVIVTASPTVYTEKGKYQLVISRMEPIGDGELYKKLEELKRRLAAEGLFAQSRKRELPLFPRRIGVVTSAAGAVFHDILKVSAQRGAGVDILLSPVPVQGADAPPAIVHGLELVQRFDVDTVIIGRGGGSAEDLWCFNDERVVRAVAAWRVPVISAVGHEVDFTLCDMAADVRAATPTHAAELAVPDTGKLCAAAEGLLTHIEARARDKIKRSRLLTDKAAEHYIIKQPARITERREQQTDEIYRELERLAAEKVTRAEALLERVCARADALSPLKVLSRGYAVAFTEKEQAVRDAATLKKDDKVRIRFEKGEALTRVEEVLL